MPEVFVNQDSAWLVSLAEAAVGGLCEFTSQDLSRLRQIASNLQSMDDKLVGQESLLDEQFQAGRLEEARRRSASRRSNLPGAAREFTIQDGEVVERALRERRVVKLPSGASGLRSDLNAPIVARALEGLPPQKKGMRLQDL